METGAVTPFDYLLVGGGLGNALIALAVMAAKPAARVGLVEQQASVGGNHVWCFHAGDVSEAAALFVTPLVEARWPRYEVRFPELKRTLEEPYAAIRSERLDELMRTTFSGRTGSRLFLGARATEVTAESVKLADGQTLHAKIVIESRGPEALDAGTRAGYQKFLGLELQLRYPCPISHPVLMDAELPQRDGFRFLYALPFAGDRVLLEDTYFSDSPELDRGRLEAEILDYAELNGFRVDGVVRRESGVLPLPTRLSRIDDPAPDAPLIAGYQGGWFHPVTGYSFPVAVRVATAVAAAEPARLRTEAWPRLLRHQRSQLRFGMLLNRLFFDAYAPEERRNVIERFYRLPTESIRRFYALTLTHGDRARILCGRPPRGFSLRRALSSAGSPVSSLRSSSGGAWS